MKTLVNIYIDGKFDSAKMATINGDKVSFGNWSVAKSMTKKESGFYNLYL